MRSVFCAVVLLCVSFLAPRAEARYFSAREGVWLSPDPLGMVDGPNLYQYVRGNPIQWTDPNGTRVERPVLPVGPSPGSVPGKLSNEARLYYAFEVGALETMVGYRLYMRLELSPKVFTFAARHVSGEGAAGETGLKPRMVHGGCSSVLGHVVEMALDFSKLDTANGELLATKAGFNASDPEALVHEMQHAATFDDGTVATLTMIEGERLAFEAQQQVRWELGYNFVPISTLLSAYTQ